MYGTQQVNRDARSLKSQCNRFNASSSYFISVGNSFRHKAVMWYYFYSHNCPCYSYFFLNES